MAFGHCLCLPLVCVWSCVSQSRAWSHETLWPVQAVTTKFGPEVQNTLVKFPIFLGVDWPWPCKVKFNHHMERLPSLRFCAQCRIAAWLKGYCNRGSDPRLWRAIATANCCRLFVGGGVGARGWLQIFQNLTYSSKLNDTFWRAGALTCIWRGMGSLTSICWGRGGGTHSELGWVMNIQVGRVLENRYCSCLSFWAGQVPEYYLLQHCTHLQWIKLFGAVYWSRQPRSISAFNVALMNVFLSACSWCATSIEVMAWFFEAISIIHHS